MSDKELMMIEERLTNEKLLITKYRVFASACRDADIKSKCNQIADSHQKHFNMLISYLQ